MCQDNEHDYTSIVLRSMKHTKDYLSNGALNRDYKNASDSYVLFCRKCGNTITLGAGERGVK